MDDLANELLDGIAIPDPPPSENSDSDGIPALADGIRATEVGNATRLKIVARGRIRYVAAWKSWLVYQDGTWRPDVGDTLVTEAAKEVPRQLFALAASLDGDQRKAVVDWAKESEKAASIAAMVRLARGIPGIRLDHRDLNRHPWLLNVTNGTIDLRTGELLDHDPERLLTKQAPVVYDPDADAPLFSACLNVWQPDADIRAYLQQVIGSGATGFPVEEIIINQGGGGNGKGKFYGAVATVLGPDYVVIPHKSLLIAQRHQQHDTVKARLYGARMAIAGETDVGDQIDEAALKELTGGDLLEARRMREDPWQFDPTHTLILHTNHKPRIRGSDEGIWRRIRLIPWNATIPPEDRDIHLAAKLAAESSGILNWIVAGAIAFNQSGLTPPDSIAAVTDAYRHDEDHVGRFLAEVCVVGDGHSVAAQDLRFAYDFWCTLGGEKPWSKQSIGRHLTERGFTTTQVGKARTRTWNGLALADSTPTEPETSDRSRPHDLRFMKTDQ